MNKLFSFIFSLILHFFILKAWVYIIDSGSVPQTYKVDLAETVLDLQSFNEPQKRAIRPANNSQKIKAAQEVQSKKLIEDIGPLLNEKDFEMNYKESYESKVPNFQVRNSSIGEETFQVKNENKIINDPDPSISKKIGNKNISKKTSPSLNKEYNIDEGLSTSNSKMAYHGESEGASIKAASNSENAFWIKKPTFLYPKSAEKQGIEGTVKLKVNVNINGTVTKAIIAEKAHPLLDEAALRDVYKGKIGAINNKTKNRISAEVIVIVPYKFGK